MRVFSVFYCFPPLLYPATMCYVKLLLGAQKNDIYMDTLSVDPDSFLGPDSNILLDKTLTKLLPNNFTNFSIKSNENTKLSKFAKSKDPLYKLFYKYFEPRKMEWVNPALKYIKKNISLSYYDLILTCSQPHSNHLIGLILKEQSGLPWVAYFSDPWADVIYRPFKSTTIHKYNLRLEHEVIKSADIILFTSEEMKELVMKKYNNMYIEKTGVLPHSFVQEWYVNDRFTPTNVNLNKIKFCHTGHFYGPRSPLPLFKTLKMLRRDNVNINNFIFEFYGGMDKTYKQYIYDNDLKNIIHFKDTIPYLQSLSVIKSSDALILIDAPLSKTKTSVFLPSKLVDYLGSNNPIIGFTPKSGTSSRVLEETGHLTCDINDIDSIYNTFTAPEKILSIKPDIESIAKYNYENIGHILKSHILDLL